MYTRQEMLSLAHRWHDLGVGTIPLLYKNKNALVKWKVWVGRCPPRPLIDQWIRTRWECNLGVLLGAQGQEGKLIVLDFDTVPVYVQWRHRFRAVAQSYTVKTSRGWHVYLWLKDSPDKTLKMNGGEVKASGYVVGEGSVHKTGWVYANVGHPSILSVESLYDVGIIAEIPAEEEREVEITPTSTERVGGVVERIKDAISVVAYLSRWTDLKKRSDGTYIGVCPFHNDHNPSLQVWPRERRAYCHSPQCRAHRRCDVITCAEFAMNVTTQEAIRFLAQELG